MLVYQLQSFLSRGFNPPEFLKRSPAKLTVRLASIFSGRYSVKETRCPYHRSQL